MFVFSLCSSVHSVRNKANFSVIQDGDKLRGWVNVGRHFLLWSPLVGNVGGYESCFSALRRRYICEIYRWQRARRGTSGRVRLLNCTVQTCYISEVTPCTIPSHASNRPPKIWTLVKDCIRNHEVNGRLQVNRDRVTWKLPSTWLRSARELPGE